MLEAFAIPVSRLIIYPFSVCEIALDGACFGFINYPKTKAYD